MTFAAPPSAVRVLVVDDSLPFREAAHALIDATRGFEWIGDAVCGEDGVEKAARLRPDLVLMDVRMPGIGGVEAARRIVSQSSSATVILVTAQSPPNGPVADTVVEIVAKNQLNAGALRRIWEQHGKKLERMSS
jgi:CheY-like chemotaxis protein